MKTGFQSPLTRLLSKLLVLWKIGSRVGSVVLSHGFRTGLGMGCFGDNVRMKYVERRKTFTLSPQCPSVEGPWERIYCNETRDLQRESQVVEEINMWGVVMP